MRILAFALPIITYAFCYWYNKRMTLKALNLQKVPVELADKRPAELPYETALYYLETFVRLFKTQNLASVASIMGDTFYYSLQGVIKGLNRLGIRKEIQLDPYPGEPGIPADYTFRVFGGGKTDVSAETITCNYSEKYIDSTTDAVLYSRELRRKRATVGVARSSAREETQAVYCINCGEVIDTSGELFICPGCRASYHADSYDWVICNIVLPKNETSVMQNTRRAVFAFMAAAALLPILSLIAGGSIFVQGFIILCCAAMLIATIRFSQVFHIGVYTGINKVSRLDPLCTAALIGMRIYYLISRLYNAHDHNPHDISTLMDENAFKAYRENYLHSGTYVLDIINADTLKTEFCLRNGRQVLDVTVKAALLTLTPERQVETVEKKIELSLYRNENTRYEYLLAAETQRCPNCSENLDMTAHGACKACRTQFDIADFDWKIASVNQNVFL
ncbi:MAG: hypothetical protein LBI19_04890 [Oscillospiraceae bacterium]|jgi:Zn finger protein HypA/HybF involved in hydrogenase expression|nr:hypothetical protein [Oscillospiraceae bacterium]